MVEYAVLLALIAVVAIAGLVVLGPSVATLFLKVVAFLSPAPAGVPVSS